MNWRRWAPVILFVLTTTCGDARRLRSLATALDREFDSQKLGVSLTDGVILTVTVADSVLLMASCDTQVAFVLRVARSLREHYPTVESLLNVNVAFAPGRPDGAIPVGAPARLPVRFSPAAVAAGLGSVDSTTALAACKAYEELGATFFSWPATRPVHS